jgi:hypothetical protein
LVSSQVVISAQGLVTLEKISVNSASTGYVNHIYMTVGETISKGRVMVDLGSPVMDEKEHILQAELDHPDPALDFLASISSAESIDGLPVTVHFDLTQTGGSKVVGKIWSRLLHLFQ